jgi:hypothetical protein
MKHRNESLVLPVFQLVGTDLPVTYRLRKTALQKCSVLATQSNVVPGLPTPIVHFYIVQTPQCTLMVTC